LVTVCPDGKEDQHAFFTPRQYVDPEYFKALEGLSTAAVVDQVDALMNQLVKGMLMAEASMGHLQAAVSTVCSLPQLLYNIDRCNCTRPPSRISFRGLHLPNRWQST
jgi:hypothetical protein